MVPGSGLSRRLHPVLGCELLLFDNAGTFNVGGRVAPEEAVNTVREPPVLDHEKAVEGLSFQQASK
jgi:hypothetical protein